MNKWLLFIFSFVLIVVTGVLTTEIVGVDFNTFMLIAILGQLLRHDIFKPYDKED